jgi:hypothetical protein
VIRRAPQFFAEASPATRVFSLEGARARALHLRASMRCFVVVSLSAAALFSCGTPSIGGVTCDTTSVRLDGVCSPAASLASGQALLVQVRESCGSACGKNSVFMCTGALDGGTLVLTALLNECRDFETTCPAVCRQATIDCIVPALNPGSYAVVGEGLGASGSLVISADAGSVSCRL